MVHIVIAGGSGQVAREVIDALLVADDHNISILSRKDTRAEDISHGVQWRTVDYNDQLHLTEALRGVHTVLSFLQLLSDPEGETQKKLIDAAVAAGVKRFAPSEYSSASIVNMPWWSGKSHTRDYLRKINENRKVLEYTLFQPGLFLDYLAYPHKTSKHVDPLQTVFDFENCRAIVVEGYENAVITFTAVADVAAMVAYAVNYEGEWPETGGIRGNPMTFSQVLETGKKVRGRSFAVEKVKVEDLEVGTLKASWALEKRHQAVSDEQYTSMVRMVTIGTLLSSTKGAWDVSGELNHLFPDHKFLQADEFLTEAWNRKQ